MIDAFEFRQGGGELGGPVPARGVGRGQLFSGRVLSAGAHEVVGLDSEREAAQSLGGPGGQSATRLVGRRCGGTLESRHGLVHLHADVGPALRVVGLGLGQDEITRELSGGHRREHRALPVGRSPLPARAGDQQRDQANGQNEHDGQEDPAPHGRAR